MSADRLELASIDAEQALLGALLYDSSIFEKIAAIISARHFFDPVHRLIFEAIAAIASRSGRVTPQAVDAAIVRSEEYRSVGGASYLHRIAANVPSIVGAPDYARGIVDLHARRELVRVAAEMSDLALSSPLSVSGESLVAQSEERFRSIISGNGGDAPRYIGHDADARLTSVLSSTPISSGLSTGLTMLDRITGGLQPGELIVVGARPSMGKSMFALALARAAIAAGLGVHFASLEMPSRQLYARLLSDYVREGAVVPYSDFGRRVISGYQADLLRDANEVLKRAPLIVDEQSGQGIEMICARASLSRSRLSERGFKLGLIIVHYLQMIPLNMQFAGAPNIAVGMSTKALKGLAKSLDVPIVLLSQLNRATESRDDKRPGLSDLRQSGEIEQDADVVAFLLRPEYYVERNEKSTDEERADARGILRVFIDKNRNGPIDAVTLDCDVSTNSVRNLGSLWRTQ